MKVVWPGWNDVAAATSSVDVTTWRVSATLRDLVVVVVWDYVTHHHDDNDETTTNIKNEMTL